MCNVCRDAATAMPSLDVKRLVRAVHGAENHWDVEAYADVTAAERLAALEILDARIAELRRVPPGAMKKFPFRGGLKFATAQRAQIAFLSRGRVAPEESNSILRAIRRAVLFMTIPVLAVAVLCAAAAPRRPDHIPDVRKMVSPTASAAPTAAHSALFAAIRFVESGGDDRAVGDDGRSVGAYQIGRAYWSDACAQGRVKWSYDDLVHSRVHCERIMRWYWARHHASTDEARARIHNGGPAGMKKRATLPYWSKVKTKLLSASSASLR